MKIQNTIKYLFLSFLLISCESEKENIEIPEIYSFKEITYLCTDWCDDIFYGELPQIEFSNKTTSVQYYTFDPLEGITESSQFASDDVSAFTFVEDSIFVNIPIDITDKNISLSSRKWLYSNKREMAKPEINLTQVISIDPYKKIIIKTRLYFHRYSTLYELTAIEKQSKIEKKINGEWTGIYPINVEVDISSN